MKEKSKGHPFAGHLHDDEEILWMHGTLPTHPSVSKIFTYLAIIGWLLWAINAIQRHDGLFLFGTSTACLMFIFACGVVIYSLDESYKTSASGIYALTNKRLLWRDGNQITELALEKVPAIRLVPGYGARGTLTFGKAAPPMKHIDDAASIKTMIDQAFNDRLEEPFA